MRRLPLVIGLFVMVLVAMITGCSHAPRYDSRLTAADSLMNGHPDSALAIVEALSPDSLATEGDRAYRDLLVTQARYKCYKEITVSDDSSANHALGYYTQRCGEREKLTRAYIYKGAVMEELGYPDSAMLYYKQAEATAAPDDYFNLGYSKLRMGSLYADYYAFDGMEIEKYEEALALFTKIGNQEYQHKCLNNLGCLYRESNPDRAEQLLTQAKSISKMRNDTTYLIEDIHALAVLHYYYDHYDQALNLIREVEQFGWPKEELSFDFCTTAANVYAKVGKPDSAMVYLNLAAQYDYKSNKEQELYYIESLGEIALARGDTATYHLLGNRKGNISNSLMSNDDKVKITRTENTFDKEKSESATRRHDILRRVLIFFIAVAVLALIIIVMKSCRHHRQEMHYHQQISELKKDTQQQLEHLTSLQQNFDKLQIKDQHIREFIDSQLVSLSQVLSACYHKPNNALGDQIKSILKYQDKNQQNWVKLFDYIDIEFNNIISTTKEHYPQLDNKDLLLIALCCMGFSYIQMATILDYSNATSVGTIKTRLAEKMGLKTSLSDYILAFSK